jgi:hypothetical protein
MVLRLLFFIIARKEEICNDGGIVVVLTVTIKRTGEADGREVFGSI